MTDKPYDHAFFEGKAAVVQASADAIVPIVMSELRPASVVDFGCGTGTWLRTFERHGVSDYLGVDGPWIPRDALEIPEERFVTAELEQGFDPGRRFDLAMSLEVAEHLPERAAGTFVASLVAAAPVVLFSAAVPHQGGEEHVNEQWQDYWRALFARHEYRPVDLIRPRIWDDDRIAFWYVQNTLVYASSDAGVDLAGAGPSPLSIVHPRLLDRVAANPSDHQRRPTARDFGLRDLLDALPRAVSRSIAWRLRRRG